MDQAIRGSAIQGVFVPLFTAFADDGAIDTGASVAHAQWVVERGVDGVVPFGTSGEGPSLSLPERVELLDALLVALPGTPTVPTVTDPSLDGALRAIEVFNDRAVEAVMVLPPFYFRPTTVDGLRAWFERIVTASRHPVLLYHIPEFAPAVPLELLTELPVWGVKDSGGELVYTLEALRAGANVMVGAEHTIVDAVAAGARGTIAGTANVLPEHLCAVVARTAAGDVEAGRTALAHLLDFRNDLLGRIGPLGWVMALKTVATARHGIPLGSPRPPVPPVAASLAAEIDPALRAALDRLVPTT